MTLIRFKIKDSWFNSEKVDKMSKQYQFGKISRFEYKGIPRTVGVIEETDKVITGYVLNQDGRPVKSFSKHAIVYRALDR